MKHLLLLSALSLLFAGAAMAGSDGPCASFAKYGAMRAFKAEGHDLSAEAKYELSHMRTKNDKSLYYVTITEPVDATVPVGSSSNQESTSYFVTAQARESSCRILDVSKTSLADF